MVWFSTMTETKTKKKLKLQNALLTFTRLRSVELHKKVKYLGRSKVLAFS